VAAAPLTAREYVEQQLLASLAEQLTTADAPTRQLETLRRVASAFARIGEDSLYADLTVWVPLVAASPEIERQQRARGLAEYALGRRLAL
jgi:hypothetical protein